MIRASGAVFMADARVDRRLAAILAANAKDVIRYRSGRCILCVAGPPRGHACERDHARHGSETPDEDDHVAVRRQQVLRFGVERVVAGACADCEPPREQRGRGRHADTDAAGAHHVQESSGLPGQRRGRGGHDRAVVGPLVFPAVTTQARKPALLVIVTHVIFAEVWPHSSHLNSWQALPPSTRPCPALAHRGQVMQASSAPSSPRIFSLLNTAGAVPPKASVERNTARSYSLRKRGVVIIDICRSKRFDTAKTQGKIRLVIMRFLPNAGIASLRAA